MSCDLCGDFSNRNICSDCRRSMQNGYHPVICQGCRQDCVKLSESLTWVERAILDPSVIQALDKMEAQIGGIAAFIRLGCPTCRQKQG